MLRYSSVYTSSATPIETVRHQIASAQKKQQMAEMRLTNAQIKIKQHRREKKGKADLIRYYESKRKMWQEKAKASVRVEELEVENAALKQQVKTLVERNQNLHADFLQKDEELERLTEQLEPEIATMENGSYTPKFRSLVYRLISRNIAFDQISPTIKDVLEFGGRTASQLPAWKTISNMNLERLPLSQTQIGVRK